MRETIARIVRNVWYKIERWFVWDLMVGKTDRVGADEINIVQLFHRTVNRSILFGLVLGLVLGIFVGVLLS